MGSSKRRVHASPVTQHMGVTLSFSSVGFLLHKHGLRIRVFFCWINHFITSKYPFVPLVMFPSLKLRVCDVRSATCLPFECFSVPYVSLSNFLRYTEGVSVVIRIKMDFGVYIFTYSLAISETHLESSICNQ